VPVERPDRLTDSGVPGRLGRQQEGHSERRPLCTTASERSPATCGRAHVLAGFREATHLQLGRARLPGTMTTSWAAEPCGVVARTTRIDRDHVDAGYRRRVAAGPAGNGGPSCPGTCRLGSPHDGLPDLCQASAVRTVIRGCGPQNPLVIDEPLCSGSTGVVRRIEDGHRPPAS